MRTEIEGDVCVKVCYPDCEWGRERRRGRRKCRGVQGCCCSWLLEGFGGLRGRDLGQLGGRRSGGVVLAQVRVVRVAAAPAFQTNRGERMASPGGVELLFLSQLSNTHTHILLTLRHISAVFLKKTFWQNENITHITT